MRNNLASLPWLNSELVVRRRENGSTVRVDAALVRGGRAVRDRRGSDGSDRLVAQRLPDRDVLLGLRLGLDLGLRDARPRGLMTPRVTLALHHGRLGTGEQSLQLPAAAGLGEAERGGPICARRQIGRASCRERV